MPTTMSRCSRATAAARSGSAYGRWLSSPMSRYASPIAEMLTKARMRVRARLTTNSRSPSKRPAPALPPSTRVVTPVLAHTASVRAPRSEAPMKQWACRSISPGTTYRPRRSIVRSPSTGSPGPTAVPRPARRRTSITPLSPAPGSRTVPPVSRRPGGEAMRGIIAQPSPAPARPSPTIGSAWPPQSGGGRGPGAPVPQGERPELISGGEQARLLDRQGRGARGRAAWRPAPPRGTGEAAEACTPSVETWCHERHPGAAASTRNTRATGRAGRSAEGRASPHRPLHPAEGLRERRLAAVLDDPHMAVAGGFEVLRPILPRDLALHRGRCDPIVRRAHDERRAADARGVDGGRRQDKLAGDAARLQREPLPFEERRPLVGTQPVQHEL